MKQKQSMGKRPSTVELQRQVLQVEPLFRRFLCLRHDGSNFRIQHFFKAWNNTSAREGQRKQHGNPLFFLHQLLLNEPDFYLIVVAAPSHRRALVTGFRAAAQLFMAPGPIRHLAHAFMDRTMHADAQREVEEGI